MIGATLGRYFFVRQVNTVLRFAFGIVLVILIVDFTELSGRIPDDTAFTPLDVIYLALLRVPNIVQTTFPFIILFASMANLMALNRKYELVIARSAGVSAWQFLAPLAAASLLFGVLAVTVINPLAARTLALAELEEVRAGIENRDDGQRSPWIRQRTAEGVTIIGAQSTAEDGLMLGNASFLKIDADGTMRERLDARTARLEDGAWVLTDVRRFRPGEQEERLDSHAIATDLEPQFVQESLASPESVPFFALPRKIEAARSFGLSANAFAMQYHALLALPVLLIAMTLIAAVVSLRFARFGQSLPAIVAGILAGFVLYVASVMIKAFGSAGIIPPLFAAWLPVIVAGMFGATILLHQEDG